MASTAGWHRQPSRSRRNSVSWGSAAAALDRMASLGARSAVAVDIDPKAVDVAYENAALNGIGRDRYTVRAGNVLSDRALAGELAQKKYHLVLANIVADVIIPLAPQVPGLLEEDGVFLCSGIIDTRADEVEAALKKNGLKILERIERDGWCAMAAALE